MRRSWLPGARSRLQSGRPGGRCPRDAAGERDEWLAAVLGMLPEVELPEDAPVVAIGGSARATLRLTRDELTVESLGEIAKEISAKPAAVRARAGGRGRE